MFTHNHYVPLLRWKLGEYQALSRLSEGAKAFITPLIEIPPVTYDFEIKRQSRSLDEHLGAFGTRLRTKWDGRTCFVDLKHIPTIDRMADGSHYVDRVFALARVEGCSAIPVGSLKSDANFINALQRAIQTDQRGVGLRLVAEDFDRAGLPSQIEMWCARLGLRPESVDLFVDLESPSYRPLSTHAQMMKQMLLQLPALNRWRTLTMLGTSYPETLEKLTTPIEIPRLEWQAYRTLVGSLESTMRVPTFGDYVVSHNDLVELDMRFVKPFAKLRYTTPDAWYLAKGKQVRAEGFDQYRGLCQALVAKPFFDGRAFSAADAYIADCAAGTVPTGNLTTWVWVAVNRHLTKVVGDLASGVALSVAA